MMNKKVFLFMCFSIFLLMLTGQSIASDSTVAELLDQADEYFETEKFDSAIYTYNEYLNLSDSQETLAQILIKKKIIDCYIQTGRHDIAETKTVSLVPEITSLFENDTSSETIREVSDIYHILLRLMIYRRCSIDEANAIIDEYAQLITLSEPLRQDLLNSIESSIEIRIEQYLQSDTARQIFEDLVESIVTKDLDRIQNLPINESTRNHLLSDLQEITQVINYEARERSVSLFENNILFDLWVDYTIEKEGQQIHNTGKKSVMFEKQTDQNWKIIRF